MSDDEVMEEDYEIGLGDDEDDFHDSNDNVPPISALARPLKGRKRFLADLEDMKNRCEIGFNWHGYNVKSTCHVHGHNYFDIVELASDAVRTDVRAGEDEGVIEFAVMTPDGFTVLSANLLVSGECYFS